MKNTGNNEIRSVSAICPVSELSNRNTSEIIRAHINYGHRLSGLNILNVFNSLNADTTLPPTGGNTSGRISPEGDLGATR